MTDRARLRTWGTTGGLSLLVIVVCVVITRDGTVPSAERDVFRAINELPDALETPMVVVQYLGVAVVPFVVAAVAAILRQWRLAIAALLVYPLKLVVEKAILKEMVERSRPARTEPDAIIRHTPTDGLSFPVGTLDRRVRARRDHRAVRLAADGGSWRSCSRPASRSRASTWGRTIRSTWSAGAAGGLLIATVLNLVLLRNTATAR